jgi:hypothetical protein
MWVLAEVKQNNPPSECGQPIETGRSSINLNCWWCFYYSCCCRFSGLITFELPLLWKKDMKHLAIKLLWIILEPILKWHLGSPQLLYWWTSLLHACSLEQNRPLFNWVLNWHIHGITSDLFCDTHCVKRMVVLDGTRLYCTKYIDFKCKKKNEI